MLVEVTKVCCSRGAHPVFKSPWSPPQQRLLSQPNLMTCLSQCGNPENKSNYNHISRYRESYTYLHTCSVDPMSHCIRSSTARHLFHPSKRTPFLTINRSFTNASPKMDPVSTGLNSVTTTTNGEGKPALRYADVRQPPNPQVPSPLTRRQADRHQPL
jgi:hypothetical protein